MLWFGWFFPLPCLRAPGRGVPGFLAGPALVFCLLLLLVHDPNLICHNFHQDVSRFTVHKGLRPNSRIMYRFFTSHQPMMNEQDQVTWTNWPASKKKCRAQCVWVSLSFKWTLQLSLTCRALSGKMRLVFFPGSHRILYMKKTQNTSIMSQDSDMFWFWILICEFVSSTVQSFFLLSCHIHFCWRCQLSKDLLTSIFAECGLELSSGPNTGWGDVHFSIRCMNKNIVLRQSKKFRNLTSEDLSTKRCDRADVMQ